MKTKIYFFILLFGLTFNTIWSQCSNNTQYPPNTLIALPTVLNATNLITDAQYAGEYAIIDTPVAGRQYTFTSTVATDFITIRNTQNTVLAFGTTPLVLNNVPINGGSLYFHLNTNAACGIQNLARTTQVQYSNNLSNVTPGNHLNFDGVNDIVNCGTSLNSIFANSNVVTLEAWVKPTTNIGTGSIAGNYSYPTNNAEMQFLVRRDGADYVFWMRNAANNSFINVVATNAVVTNTWQHIAAVRNGNAMKIYIDGVLMNTTTGVGTQNFIPNTANEFTIGGNASITAEEFSGAIDEVRVWNAALNATQINRRKNCELQGNEAGLVAYYKFNQGYAASNNSILTTLPTTIGTTGTLNNFALTGSTSNWVTGSPVTTGSIIPNAPAVSPQIFCNTTASSLVPTIGSTIKWYPSATATTALLPTDVLTTKTYFVASVNANGCESERVASAVTVTQFNNTFPEILYYKFDGSGSTVPNLASESPIGAENATIMGSITQGGIGNSGGALIGTGTTSTTDYLNTNWNTNLGTKSWTIAFWSKGVSINPNIYYAFGDNTANSFGCYTNGIAGNTNWLLTGGGLANVTLPGGALSTPTFCVFVYDNIANTVKAYLNGTLVNTVSQTPNGVNIVGTSPFKIMGYETNIGAPAGGLLDDFGLFNRPLSLTEVQNIYQQGINTMQTFCSGATVANLQPSLFITTKWYAGSTGGSELATTEILTSGSYFATPVNGTCEGARTPVNVSVTTLNNATTQNAGIITATENAVGVTYQWFECPNTLINSATNQSFTPTTSSNYKVEITKGACVVTSACDAVLGTNNFVKNNGLQIFPNPVNDVLTIDLNSEISEINILNLLGQSVKSIKNATKINVSDLENGVYLLEIYSNNKIYTSKIIKSN